MCRHTCRHLLATFVAGIIILTTPVLFGPYTLLLTRLKNCVVEIENFKHENVIYVPPQIDTVRNFTQTEHSMLQWHVEFRALLSRLTGDTKFLDVYIDEDVNHLNDEHDGGSDEKSDYDEHHGHVQDKQDEDDLSGSRQQEYTDRSSALDSIETQSQVSIDLEHPASLSEEAHTERTKGSDVEVERIAKTSEHHDSGSQENPSSPDHSSFHYDTTAEAEAEIDWGRAREESKHRFMQQYDPEFQEPKVHFETADVSFDGQTVNRPIESDARSENVITREEPENVIQSDDDKIPVVDKTISEENETSETTDPNVHLLEDSVVPSPEGQTYANIESDIKRADFRPADDDVVGHEAIREVDIEPHIQAGDDERGNDRLGSAVEHRNAAGSKDSDLHDTIPDENKEADTSQRSDPTETEHQIPGNASAQDGSEVDHSGYSPLGQGSGSKPIDDRDGDHLQTLTDHYVFPNEQEIIQGKHETFDTNDASESDSDFLASAIPNENTKSPVLGNEASGRLFTGQSPEFASGISETHPSVNANPVTLSSGTSQHDEKVNQVSRSEQTQENPRDDYSMEGETHTELEPDTPPIMKAAFGDGWKRAHEGSTSYLQKLESLGVSAHKAREIATQIRDLFAWILRMSSTQLKIALHSDHAHMTGMYADELLTDGWMSFFCGVYLILLTTSVCTRSKMLSVIAITMSCSVILLFYEAKLVHDGLQDVIGQLNEAQVRVGTLFSGNESSDMIAQSLCIQKLGVIAQFWLHRPIGIRVSFPLVDAFVISPNTLILLIIPNFLALLRILCSSYGEPTSIINSQDSMDVQRKHSNLQSTIGYGLPTAPATVSAQPPVPEFPISAKLPPTIQSSSSPQSDRLQNNTQENNITTNPSSGTAVSRTVAGEADILVQSKTSTVAPGTANPGDKAMPPAFGYTGGYRRSASKPRVPAKLARGGQNSNTSSPEHNFGLLPARTSGASFEDAKSHSPETVQHSEVLSTSNSAYNTATPNQEYVGSTMIDPSQTLAVDNMNDNEIRVTKREQYGVAETWTNAQPQRSTWDTSTSNTHGPQPPTASFVNSEISSNNVFASSEVADNTRDLQAETDLRTSVTSFPVYNNRPAFASSAEAMPNDAVNQHTNSSAPYDPNLVVGPAVRTESAKAVTAPDTDHGNSIPLEHTAEEAPSGPSVLFYNTSTVKDQIRPRRPSQTSDEHLQSMKSTSKLKASGTRSTPRQRGPPPKHSNRST